MSDQDTPPADQPADQPAAVNQPIVNALLICRGIEAHASGELTIENVVEVLPVEEVPTEVGPIVLVAMVRGLPPGPGKGAFLIRPPGEEGKIGRLPLETDVPQGFQGRQVALQVTLPKFPVQEGGWFDVHFEWNAQVLASNRFAVGVRSS